MRRILPALAALPALIGAAAAQNTGGVFPPMVNDGASALEYRATLRPVDGGDDRFAQRLHYQASPNGNLMWRVVAQTNGTIGEQSFDYVQGELFWELSGDDAPWRTGLRFDARVRNGAAPEQVNVNWTNQWRLSERWSARGILLTSAQIGDRAADGIGLETRANVFYRTENGTLLGVESYNPHGRTEDVDLFGPGQQVGPFAVWPVAEGWGLFTGVLLGASDDAADADYRLWLTRNF